MVKKGKHHHHKNVDPTNGLMNLVQTPATYAAWKPGASAGNAGASSAAASMEAAKAAFDAPDFMQVGLSSRMGTGMAMLRTLEGVRAGLRTSQSKVAILASEAGSAAEDEALLESSDQPVNTGNVDAANLVLEQYATTLQSTPLLQLSHARLSLPKLRRLWAKVQSAGTGATSSGHEAQAAKWCQDFQRDSAAQAAQRKVRERQARLSLMEANTRTAVLQQQELAQSQLLEAADRDVQQLRALQERLQHQFDSTLAAVHGLQAAAGAIAGQGAGAEVQRDLGGLFEKLGRAEGIVPAGNTEILDIVAAALQRREHVVSRLQQSQREVQGALRSAQQQQSSLLQRSAGQQTSASGSSLESRYEQMCNWTLEELENRKHREEMEKDAIHAALIVLSAH